MIQRAQSSPMAKLMFLKKLCFEHNTTIKNSDFFLDGIKKCLFLRPLSSYGLVVQLVRIRACHARGRGFESRPDRKI